MADYGHPLRLGIRLGAASAAPAAVLERARLGEELGLDLLTVADLPHDPDALDAWTTLSWVAGVTEHIRLVPHVLNVRMRPPAVVARAAASLDLLTGGRLELGLGAGGDAEAMAAMGTARLTPEASADALAEAVGVIRAVWSGDQAPLHLPGSHHRLAGAQAGPAPAHLVPVWVRAGADRLLRLVGRTADGWVAPGPRPGHELREANEVIDAAAVEAGRDPREIRRWLSVAGTDRETEEWVADLFRLAVDGGFSTFVLTAEDEPTVRRFATEVGPALRAAVAADRAARGVVEGTVPSAAFLAARRPGIDYDGVPASLADTAVEPGDPRYGGVRSTYMRGGSPGLVLRPRDVAGVVDALGFARAQDVPLAVRSGGHGISGRSTNDGGIVIDLSALRGIEVLDEATRRVRIEPGARWGEVAAALRPHGWALTSGDYGGVGVGGLATAGGIGFLAREHGLTIDHLRAVQMVLADGSVVRASAEENPDLFWGVRGAGSGLGIVTSFEFEVEEVGDVGWAQLVFDASDTADFLRRWGDTLEAAPRDVNSFLILGAPRGGQVVAQVLAMVDSADPDVIIDRLQPFAAIAPLLQQSVQVVPYAGVISTPAPHTGQGEPVARSGLVDHLDAAWAQAAADLVRSGATYFFQIRGMGGAVADTEPDATAFAHRSANFSVVAFGSSQARLDRFWEPLAAHHDGLYVSFETGRSPDRVRAAYPPATLERLRALKAVHDPENVFRDNLGVGPLDLAPAGR